MGRVITRIEDLCLLAKSRVPRAIFEYVDRGSYEELTLSSNRKDLLEMKLRQRVLIDVAKRNLSTKLVGDSASIPAAPLSDWQGLFMQTKKF